MHGRWGRALPAGGGPAGDRGAPDRRLPDAHRAADRLLHQAAQAGEHRRPDDRGGCARRYNAPAERAQERGWLSVIIYKSQDEIELMREAGAILAETLNHLQSLARPGTTLLELDPEGARFLRARA